MPLMMLPMAPGVGAELGQQPDSGHGRGAAAAMGLIEGNYAEALPYVVPVCGVTLFAACWRFAGP